MNLEDYLVLFVAVVWLIVLAGFALPSVIAFQRRDPNRWLILAISASVVGWALALALSVYPLLRLGGLQGPDVDDVSHRMADQLPLPLAASQANGMATTPGGRLSTAATLTEIERLDQL